MKVHGNLGNRAGLAPLKSALEAYALRHRTIAGNIANAETPGYQRKTVEFEAIAKRALGSGSKIRAVTTHPGHLSAGGGAPGDIEAQIENAGVTDPQNAQVDMETEMVSMVENQLQYRLAVRMLSMKYRQLHSAIVGTVR